MTGHVTAPPAALADGLPDWVTLLRAPNPGPMTLDGTNTWVLRAPGAQYAVVVDPGPPDEGHLAAHRGARRRSGSILITHGHPDHAEGARPAARAARRRARARRRPGAHHRRSSRDRAGRALERLGLASTVDTPGHTADSVCFLVERGGERVVLTGDTILGRGTTVVAHPDGHLGDYLTSLDRLGTYPGVPGAARARPGAGRLRRRGRFYLDHRRARLDQVRAGGRRRRRHRRRGGGDGLRRRGPVAVVGGRVVGPRPAGLSGRTGIGRRVAGWTAVTCPVCGTRRRARARGSATTAVRRCRPPPPCRRPSAGSSPCSSATCPTSPRGRRISTRSGSARSPTGCSPRSPGR